MKKFLLPALVAGIALLLGLWYLGEHPEKLPVIQESLKKPVPVPKTHKELVAEALGKIRKTQDEVKGNTVAVDLSPIAGYHLCDLYTKYLGLPCSKPGRPVPGKVTVSFDERMAAMYHQKVEYERCKIQKKTKQKICVVASDTVLSHAPSLLENYRKADKMRMDLNEFIRIADQKVALGKKSIDWTPLCRSRAYKLDSRKCELLRSIVGDLRGADLVAYGMTELLPSDNGHLNAKYIDLMLRNAGAQFLYHVPALGDRYASLGIYQFTFFALREDPQQVAGVNVVNAYVKEGGEKVPGSVVKLSGHQHHTAAFYFAVHNLASMVSRLSKAEEATLRAIHRAKQDEMVVIIACAHHAPGYTFPAVSRWLKAIEEAKRPPKLAKAKKGAKPKQVSTELVAAFRGHDMTMYAKKSKANLIAVYAWK